MKATEEAIEGMVIGNFLIATFVSFSLSYLWGLINALQMIVYLPLFNINFPANINMFNSILISVATFDIIPKIDKINKFVFKFKYTEEEISHKAAGFVHLGFETKNFTLNSGSLLIFVFAFLIKAILITITRILA